MKLIWRILFATLILIPLVQSCELDDDSGYYPWGYAEKMTIGTIKTMPDADDEYYLLIDNGNKMYFGDLSKFRQNYEWKDGQRVFLYFNTIDEKIPGYELNAEVVQIENILTKDVIDMDEETVDSIGKDQINITGLLYGGGHINIEFEFYGSKNPQKLHMVNLVRNNMEEIQEEDGYIVLEFRHNAYNDYKNEKLVGVASFRPPFGNDASITYKGAKIKVHSIYEGVITKTVDFSKQETYQYTGKTSVVN